MNDERDESSWCLSLIGCGIVVMYAALLYCVHLPTVGDELGGPVERFEIASQR
jgi:hypothetical protein